MPPRSQPARVRLPNRVRPPVPSLSSATADRGLQDLLSFVALQLRLDVSLGETYTTRQHTVSDHQARIREYLGLNPFGEELPRARDSVSQVAAARL